MPRYTVSITRFIVSYVAVPSVTVYLGAALTANGFDARGVHESYQRPPPSWIDEQRGDWDPLLQVRGGYRGGG